jgi:hypothetical protein
MLINKANVDIGLWTVISCTTVSYPGPWEQIHMLLLGRSMLVNVDVEKGRFAELWDVVHVP